ncbi:hypothetical protein INR49_008959 [Caranx melampygus]|nr:hypothetical protein INR49_008959 [Caranx melampygus]
MANEASRASCRCRCRRRSPPPLPLPPPRAGGDLMISDTWNSQNVSVSSGPRPLTAGHAPVIGRSPEVRVQSGSCLYSEERSEVDFHRSSPFLPSPGRVLPAHRQEP